MFCGISAVVFRIKNSSAVFLLGVSAKAKGKKIYWKLPYN